MAKAYNGLMGEVFAKYRELNPNGFSDSKRCCRLTGDLLRLRLNELSERMMQDAFEQYALGLLRLYVTPNILPPTGPNAGGDGKTDLETYPVSDDVSLYWAVENNGAVNENWAFAISTRKDWKRKLKEDVASVFKRERIFAKCYFVSSRKMQSRERKKLCEQLSSQYGLEVVCLDQEWLVAHSMTKDGVEVAVKTLNFDSSYLQYYDKQGPLDCKREQELEFLLKQVENPGNLEGVNTAYIEKVSRVALLQRGLELDPYKTKAYFDRAIHLCKKHGLKQQLYGILYDYAMTYLYWLDQVEDGYQIYQQMKSMLQEDVNVDRVEKAFVLLDGMSYMKLVDGILNDMNLEDEWRWWQTFYEELNEENRTRGSRLFIEFELLIHELMNSELPKERLSVVCERLKDNLKASDVTIESPVESHIVSLRQVAEQWSEDEVDELLEYVTQMEQRRMGEIEKGTILAKDADRYLRQNKWQKAVRTLIESGEYFQKEQTNAQLITVTELLAGAYEKLGKLYVAKNQYVKAIALRQHDTQRLAQKEQDVLHCAYRICHLDIRMGQVVDFLVWYRYLTLLAGVMKSSLFLGFEQDMMALDAEMGARILASRLTTVDLEPVQPLFAKHGLYIANSSAILKMGKTPEPEFLKGFYVQRDWNDVGIARVNSGMWLGDAVVVNSCSAWIETSVSAKRLRINYADNVRYRDMAEIIAANMEVIDVLVGHEWLQPKEFSLAIEEGKGQLEFDKLHHTCRLMYMPTKNLDQAFFDWIAEVIGLVIEHYQMDESWQDNIASWGRDMLLYALHSVAQYENYLQTVLGGGYAYKVEMLEGVK